MDKKGLPNPEVLPSQNRLGKSWARSWNHVSGCCKRSLDETHLMPLPAVGVFYFVLILNPDVCGVLMYIPSVHMKLATDHRGLKEEFLYCDSFYTCHPTPAPPKRYLLSSTISQKALTDPLHFCSSARVSKCRSA